MMEELIMKKLFVIACAFAAVIGCQKAEMEMPQENEGVKVPVQVTATIAQTKTTMTNEGGVLKSAWKDGDKIYVTQCRDETYDNECVDYEASVSEGVTEFIKNAEKDFSGPGTYASSRIKLYAMYPDNLGGNRVNNKSFTMAAEQTQSAPGDLSHIASDNILVALPTEVDWSKTPVDVDLEFKHALSVLELDLNASAAGVNISKILVDVTGGEETDYLVVTNGSFNLTNGAGGTMTKTSGVNSITLNLASIVELPVEDYAKFYMTITPGHAGQTFTVKVVTDMGETLEVGSMKVPSDGSIPQGAKALKKFTVQAPQKEEIDYSSAIDLSPEEGGTANTYIVNAPNTVYKFNAQVMGNGTVPTQMADVLTSTAIAPKTALSLWYTCKQTSTAWVDAAPIDVSSIKLEDGYIYFKTPETFVNGNMVIAAFAEEGLTYSNITVNENREFTNATILWSWDIWAVEGYDPETSKITVGQQYLMDRNLGALVGLSDADAAANLTNGVWVANGQGNYYEYGRKDPFPGFAEYPGVNPLTSGEKLLTTPAYTLINALQMNGVGSSQNLDRQMFGTEQASSVDVSNLSELDALGLLNYVNGNPHKDIYANRSPYTWQSNGLNPYWNVLWGDETYGEQSYKTIYDPCPLGWKLWDYSTMESFAIAYEQTATLLSNDKQTCFGLNIAGSLFPFSGGRQNAFSVNGNVCLKDQATGKTTGVALNTSSRYSYNSTYHSIRYPGNASPSNWAVTVREGDVLEVSITSVDSNNNRQYVNTSAAYTCRAIPVRCIKE